MTGFSWSLYIQTNLLRSLYIMTEMMAVRIYNDRFRIRTITYIYSITVACCTHYTILSLAIQAKHKQSACAGAHA